MSGKYTQKLLDHAKQSAIDTLKTSSKRVIQKRADATYDLIGNKFANKITRVSKNLPQNNSKTFINKHDEELPKARYITPEEWQKITDCLRLI